jgi:hypothetical protein
MDLAPAYRSTTNCEGLSFTTSDERRVTSNESPCGYGEGEPPVPIPNTAVKPLSADGTGRVTGWESRSLQGIYFPRNPLPLEAGFLLFFLFLFFNTNLAKKVPGRKLGKIFKTIYRPMQELIIL